MMANPHEERRRHLGHARDALVRAAALLLDDGFLEDAAPTAAVLASAALIYLGKADVFDRDAARAVELSQMLRDQAHQREQG